MVACLPWISYSWRGYETFGGGNVTIPDLQVLSIFIVYGVF